MRSEPDHPADDHQRDRRARPSEQGGERTDHQHKSERVNDRGAGELDRHRGHQAERGGVDAVQERGGDR